MSDQPDPRRELATVLDAIATANDEHLATTGRPALHLGPCGRSDLHEQLVGLYARAKTLAEEQDRRRKESARAVGKADQSPASGSDAASHEVIR